MYRIFIILGLIVLGQACSYTPAHNVPVKPEFINAGVKPGDVVEIVTTSGEAITVEVVEVLDAEIVGLNRRVLFSDISVLKVRSWTLPEHPCGAGEPVGCSIPEVVLLLSETYKGHAQNFHPACVRHDFCYRHGFATYGIEREACDSKFYQAMKNACAPMGVMSIMDVKGYATCQAAALQTYKAVSRYGEGAYRTVESTVCEY